MPSKIKKCIILFVIIITSAAFVIGGYFLCNLKKSLKLNGILELRRENAFEDPILLLIDPQTGKEKVFFENAFKGMKDSPFLSGEKLYFVADVGTHFVIKSIDVLTGQEEIIPLTYSEGNFISSPFIKKDNLYYFAGEYCGNCLLEHMTLDLMNYNLTSGETKTLMAGVKADHIEGFDSTGNRLIVDQGASDVICSVAEFQIFSFLDNTIDNIGSYVDCESSVHFDDSLLPFKDIITAPDSVGYLVLKNGKIFIPEPNEQNSGTIDIRVDKSKYQSE